MTRDQPLRLFVDAHVFDDLPQGTLTFIREIYLVMARQRDIHLYLGACDTGSLAKFFPPGDTVFLVQYKSRSGLRRLLFDIPAIIRKNRIDYAHFQYITPIVKNCKWIVTIHDVIFKDFPAEFSWSYRVMKRVLYGISALRADILTTVSDFSGESIRRFLHTGNRPIHVIHNGVGANYFEPYDKQRSREHLRARYGFDRFLLYVSRIEPRKNHVFLLQAWLELKLYAQGIHLVFLGHETIPVPAFDRMLAGLPQEVRKFIYIDSGVKDRELLEMYRAATLFVYPSKAEGFGIPPLEAAALEVPVLCSNTSAMKDFSFFSQFDPYDYPAFVRLLQNALETPPDPVLLAGIRETVRRDYTWESSAAILHGLLARSRKNATLADL